MGNPEEQGNGQFRTMRLQGEENIKPGLLIEHDIRNSLSCIRAAVRLMAEQCTCTWMEEVSMISSIDRSCDRASHLVDCLTALSCGNVGMNAQEETDLFKLVVGVTEAAAGQAAVKGVSVAVDVAPRLPKPVLNRHLVERAVANLVDNAVKYTAHGGHVFVRVDKMEEDGQDRIVISVSDDGPGIPYEEQARVCEMYYRSTNTSHIKGYGLGLVVVKNAADAHGGYVELKSEPGKGSEFRIVLPVKSVA